MISTQLLRFVVGNGACLVGMSEDTRVFYSMLGDSDRNIKEITLGDLAFLCKKLIYDTYAISIISGYSFGGNVIVNVFDKHTKSVIYASHTAKTEIGGILTACEYIVGLGGYTCSL